MQYWIPELDIEEKENVITAEDEDDLTWNLPLKRRRTGTIKRAQNNKVKTKQKQTNKISIHIISITLRILRYLTKR